MIRYVGHRPSTGENVCKLDRLALLHRLVTLSETFDLLVAADERDAAMRVRRTAIEVLRRLGMPGDRIRTLSNRSGPLPSVSEGGDDEEAGRLEPVDLSDFRTCE